MCIRDSVYIKKGQGRALKAGGLWIYDNEIDRTEGEFENGDMVNVFDFDGYPLGCEMCIRDRPLEMGMMGKYLASARDAVISWSASSGISAWGVWSA